MSKYGWLGAVALWLCTVTAAHAEFDNRFYVTPMIGGVFSDSSDLDTGPFGGLIVGKNIAPLFGVELEANYSKLDVADLPSESDYERITLGVNLLGYLARDTHSFRPFVMLSGNGHSIDFLGESLGGAGVGAGAGSLFKLGTNWDARFDVRYNLDFISGKGVVRDDTFYIWSAALGISYKFGADPYDDDGDGVPNTRDKCPGTPRGVRVDADGCPFDADGDGVPDHLDRCPNTPAGVTVDVNGCPIDSDGDGVPDYIDQCPGTPKGQAVGPDGCPKTVPIKCPDTPPGITVGPDNCPLDSDGDGIPDYLDECPNTPPGLKVLPDGCAPQGDCRRPRPGEQVDANGCAIDRSFVLRGVKFEFDSDRLTPKAREILNEVAETLKAYPNIDVELEGHTDSIGTDAYNQGLSERRANSVKRYLVDRGVEARRMTPIGYGESQPIADNETEPGREENRRVELTVRE